VAVQKMDETENAGRQPGAQTKPTNTDSTALLSQRQGEGTAQELAARLWPPPDPINFCKRRAVESLSAADLDMRQAVGLRTKAGGVFFSNLASLWIHDTHAERLLVLSRARLLDAARHIGDVLDDFRSARLETLNRLADERLRATEERDRG
jgi:hypothetical protein